MQIVTNVYPHNWPYILNFTRGPFTNLSGCGRRRTTRSTGRTWSTWSARLATPEYAEVPPSLPYYGHPVIYKFDKAKAHALLQEAGCLPCKITLAISTSGSGQMQSLPMNELVKQQLEDAGFQVTLQVMDWNALLDVSRSGVPKYPNVDGLNASRGLLDPVSAIIKPVATAYWSPAGSNWGHFGTPEASTGWSSRSSRSSTRPSAWLLLTKLHEYESAQALMIFVVHDLNPRALSPKVHGFVQAQNWFQDLTPITVDP